MPYQTKDVERHIKGLSDHQKVVWVRVANAILQECTGDDCEGKAVRQANAVAKRAPKTATEAQLIPLDAALELLSEAELSLDERRSAVYQALRTQTTAKLGTSCWIRDLYDDYVVYELEGPDEMGTYRRDYTIAADGTVTLGDVQKVRLVTSYEPVAESASDGEVAPDDAADAALVADGDEAEDDAEEAALELSSDLIPLLERALASDGTFPMKIIAPGWGSSGHYPAEVLKRDGPKVFPSGTHMYFDHPSASENRDRPERSVRDLAAITVSDAAWSDGPEGPGLYAQAKPFSQFAPLIEELAPHIGVSIRAAGFSKPGEIEGRKGPVIERLVHGHSIDLVTKAGAGGKVLQLMESVGRPPNAKEVPVTGQNGTEGQQATPQTQTEAQPGNVIEQFQQMQESLARLEAENRRLQEQQLIQEGSAMVRQALARYPFHEMTRDRLAEGLVAKLPIQNGQIDREQLAKNITEAAQREAQYLANVGGTGQVRGMGPSLEPEEVTAEEAEKQLGGALQSLWGIPAGANR